jgi:hypothetical protein
MCLNVRARVLVCAYACVSQYIHKYPSYGLRKKRKGQQGPVYEGTEEIIVTGTK